MLKVEKKLVKDLFFFDQCDIYLSRGCNHLVVWQCHWDYTALKYVIVLKTPAYILGKGWLFNWEHQMKTNRTQLRRRIILSTIHRNKGFLR